MGIKDGTKIKKVLRDDLKDIMHREVGSSSDTYDNAKTITIDVMLDIYTKPPFIKTGKGLHLW
jgi:hypothetical protein